MNILRLASLSLSVLLVSRSASAVTLAIEPPLTYVTDQDTLLLDGDGFDMELDTERERVYVSVPSRNEVVVVEVASLQVINRISLAGAPHGLDLSIDGSLLFVALNQAGALAFVDLETFAHTTVEVRSQLGDVGAWDVVEARPNRVFVSANPTTPGTGSWIAMVKRDEGNAVSRVANGEAMLPGAVLAATPDGQFLFVAESPAGGFARLFKLDLSTDAAPIALSRLLSTQSGAGNITVSPDGQRLYFGTGDVYRTGTLEEIAGFGTYGADRVRLNPDGTRVFLAAWGHTVESFDTVTRQIVDRLMLPCPYQGTRGFEVLEGGGRLLILETDGLCSVYVSSERRLSCRLTPSFAGGVVTLNFDLAAPAASVWNVWVTAGNAAVPLWKLSIPVLDPAVAVSIALPALPQMGTIEVGTTLTTDEGIVCSDFKTVETGGSGSP